MPDGLPAVAFWYAEIDPFETVFFIQKPHNTVAVVAIVPRVANEQLVLSTL